MDNADKGKPDKGVDSDPNAALLEEMFTNGLRVVSMHKITSVSLDFMGDLAPVLEWTATPASIKAWCEND